MAATGSHTCADLAVFRLAASDGARRAIEIAVATDWAPQPPRLDLLFKRCVQVAENDDQLRRLAARAASLGLDVATRDEVLSGPKYEELLNALALHTLDQDGPGKALSLAQRTAFADHRTPAALALWVDFHIELGRLDDALAIAEQLVGAWPDHPLPHLKVAQCLTWLDLRAETETSLLAAADRLARLPRAAVDVLKALARYDLDGARGRPPTRSPTRRLPRSRPSSGAFTTTSWRKHAFERRHQLPRPLRTVGAPHARRPPRRRHPLVRGGHVVDR